MYKYGNINLIPKESDMKAIQVNEYQTPIKLNVLEVAQPSAKDGQVLIKVMAASINPFDVTLATGAMASMIPLSLPYTIGGDVAGIVEGTGQEVYGSALIVSGGSGSMAEYAVANLANVADKPKSLSFAEAASLPLAGVSALQAIEEHLDLQSGQKILIHGGAGGIGTLAIQLAKMKGSYVATTANGVDREMLAKLGADLVIDYKTEDFTKVVSEYDAVFDTVGGEVTTKSVAVLKRGGKLVTMIGQVEEKLAAEAGVTIIRQMTGVTSTRLAKLAGYVATGKVKPAIDKVFSLDQTSEAYDYFVNEHPKGKVVVEVAK